jgi:predicted RecB family nuclease
MNTMKKPLPLIVIVGAILTMALVTGCQTTTTNQAAIAASQKEVLLAQSGFKVKTVTTQKQQQHVSQLAVGRVSAVKYNGKVYYVYPTATKDRIYVGNQAQFNAYKQTLRSRQLAQQGQQQMAGTPDITEETAGPHHVEVEQFDSFGPMGVQSLGNW